MSSDKKEAILDFAEREIRKGGFDAVSFRDIANAVGIKSASVHYHFPTKADLGQAVVQRYAQRFIETLDGKAEDKDNARERIESLADGYLESYQKEHATCLCAVLGATPSHLSPELNTEVLEFYQKLLGWTEKALNEAGSRLTPETVVSALQGGMILSVAQNTSKPLEDVRRMLLEMVANEPEV